LGGGISTYSYVGAAPLTAVDPLGLSARNGRNAPPSHSWRANGGAGRMDIPQSQRPRQPSPLPSDGGLIQLVPQNQYRFNPPGIRDPALEEPSWFAADEYQMVCTSVRCTPARPPAGVCYSPELMTRQIINPMNPPSTNEIARMPNCECDRSEFRDLYFDRLNPSANDADFLDLMEIGSQVLEVRSSMRATRTR